MAYEEGFRRIKFVVRIVLVVGLVLVAVGAVGVTVSNFNFHWIVPAIFGVYISIFAGILWTAAWIIEGFIRGPRVPQQ